MPQILLNTSCFIQPDNSYSQMDTYYDTDRRAAQQSPLTSTTSVALTCTPYQIPDNTFIESYCGFDVSNQPALLTVTSAGGTNQLQHYNIAYSQSANCTNSTLAITTQQAYDTTLVNVNDGQILIEATTTFPPINCYLPGVGAPTRTTTFNANTPAPTYQFVYNNLAPGTYTLEVQDANNSKLYTRQLVIHSGNTIVDNSVTWFKYRWKDNVTSLPTTVGYAWDKVHQGGYKVEKPINIPVFNINKPTYVAGALVLWSLNTVPITNAIFPPYIIFRAKKNMEHNSQFNSITMPSKTSVSAGDWEIVNNGFGYFDANNNYVEIKEFDKANVISQNIFGKKHGYEKDTIITYGWGNYYKAKVEQSFFYPLGQVATNPPAPTPPTPFATSNEWEYLANYTDLSYVVPASTIVDTYSILNLLQEVSFYSYNPALPTYVPTATSVYPVIEYPGDYVLINSAVPYQINNTGDLQILDIIENNIVDANAENGSAWIIATSPSQPLSFHMVNGVRAGYVQDNQSGRYENLTAGKYEVQVTDAAGRTATANFEIKANYGLRWRLKFNDLQKNALEVQVWQPGWQGAVTDVTGTGTPVELSWGDGSSPDGALPELVGAELKFNLYAHVARQFADTALAEDETHRIDFYRNNSLHFRGYVDSSMYSEGMVGGTPEVSISAFCGLGKLKRTLFTNHLQEKQSGRTSMLSILLKCLSYTDANLKVNIGVNLRDKLMSVNGESLLEAFIWRQNFDTKDNKVISVNDYVDAGTVITYILRLFNAQIFQGNGAWHIISLNEVHETTVQVRTYTAAGTLLRSGNTEAPTLSILSLNDATASNELYFINASQVQTVIPGVRNASASVKLKLVKSLFENGNFVTWINNRPAAWTTAGNAIITKADGEKADEYAVKFGGYDTVYNSANYLLSPAVPHLTGINEEFYRLTIRALVEAATQNPAAVTAKLYIQMNCDGVDYGNPIAIPLSSADKWKDYTVDFPLGLPGTKFRIKVIEPVQDATSAQSTLKINSLSLAIQPGLRDWSGRTEDLKQSNNPLNFGGIELEAVELANADIPDAPDFSGKPIVPTGMAAFAWLQCISLADYTATSAWLRPGAPVGTVGLPILDNAAEDRMAIRTNPGTVVEAEVAGKAINLLRVGLMLDMPQELVDGKYLVTSCSVDEKAGIAKVSLYKLADGDYSVAPQALPANVRRVKVYGKKGYRVATVNGAKGFRVIK